MKIRVIAIGKTTQNFLTEGIEYYVKRIKNFISFDYQEIQIPKTLKNNNPSIVQKIESNKLLTLVKQDDLLLLLHENGLNFSTEKFSNYLNNLLCLNYKTIIFAIGGAYGFSNDIKSVAYSLISLSSMTFSHQLVRLIFLEQLYRTFTIIHNHPYHH